MSAMTEDIVAMARAAKADERLSDGALYGKLADEVERLRAECFTLAAGACHGGYGDESGNWRCNYQDEIRRYAIQVTDMGEDLDREHAASLTVSNRLQDVAELIATALGSLLKYGEDHNWGFMPEGKTIDNAYIAKNIYERFISNDDGTKTPLST